MTNLLEADVIVLRGFPFLLVRNNTHVVRGLPERWKLVTRTCCMLGKRDCSPSGLSTVLVAASNAMIRNLLVLAEGFP